MQISSRNLVESLIGVVAIWPVFRNIPDYVTTLFLSSTGTLESHQPVDVAALQAVHLVAGVACGLVLIVARSTLARWLVREPQDVGTTTRSLYSLGAACIGLYLTGTGLSSFVFYLVNFREMDGIDPYLRWSGASSILIGVLVMFSAPWIARFLHSRDSSDAA